MKICCAVEISNRKHFLVGTQRPQSYRTATLSLCSKFEKNEQDGKDLCLVLSTLTNPTVAKYNVYKNVGKVFGKFVKDGKATIRFEDPPHDVIISKADHVKLMHFLKIVQIALDGKDLQELHFPSVTTKVKPEKKTLVVTSKDSYPSLSGFPSSLIRLEIQNCYLCKIDRRIFSLKHLKILDLAHNCLKELPSSLSEMPLAKLILHHNKLRRFPKELSIGILGKTLQTLDLSYNEFQELDPFFCGMNKINILILKHNSLRSLPRNVHLIESLKQLDVSHNLLNFLPYGLRSLCLESLDISYNSFDSHGFSSFTCSTAPSLLECAAAFIVENRVPYGLQDLPLFLIEYLLDHAICACGKRIFQKTASQLGLVNLEVLASTVIHSNDVKESFIPLRAYFCPLYCRKVKL